MNPKEAYNAQIEPLCAARNRACNAARAKCRAARAEVHARYAGLPRIDQDARGGWSARCVREDAKNAELAGLDREYGAACDAAQEAFRAAAAPAFALVPGLQLIEREVAFRIVWD